MARRKKIKFCRECSKQIVGLHGSAMFCSVACHLEHYTARVEETGCWEWSAGLTQRGYGKIKVGGRTRIVSRVSFELANGVELPPDRFVCHHCDNPRCHNPAHLFAGSQKENMADAMSKGRVASGLRNAAAKLTPDQVLALRASTATSKSLAGRLGVSEAAVYFARTGHTWKHLPG